jgi:uncharacterized membrane protein YkvA (DUF1232 family)
MISTLIDWAIPLAVSVLVIWLLLIVAMFVGRPKDVRPADALRLLPDTIRLLRRLATDGSVPRAARVRLWLLFAYLAFPIDIVPDFIPVIGHVDDVIVVALVLRSVVRHAGFDSVERHWPGTDEGLRVLARLARLEDRRGVG